jgi:hypothetical protein
MRSSVGPFADRLWHEKKTGISGPFETNAEAEQVYLAIQKLSPQDDLQRALQSRAAQLSNDLAQTRLLLFVESDSLVPASFLAILAFWLVIIFASFSLFSPLNVTVFTCLSLFALSAACAIFLILELSQPFHNDPRAFRSGALDIVSNPV